jgi:hypothetical protein
MTTAKKSAAGLHMDYHRDGSMWAWERLKIGAMAGCGEPLRVDGILFRTGCLKKGRRPGTRTEYDNKGKVSKLAAMEPAAEKTR